MKKIFLFNCLLLIFTNVSSQKTVIDSIFNIVDKEGFSGVILYAKDSKVKAYRSSGYKNYEKKIKIKKSDIFELASISKQFTALLIMMCKEKGLLQYDDLVEKYLKIPYKGMTIRHLLHHTSGLPDYQAIMDQHWDKSKVASNEDIISYLNQYIVSPSFLPGEKYEYSNTGYVLLASIVENVTGQDFVAICKNWIFEPLGMKDTKIRTNIEKGLEKRFAYGHMMNESGTYENANRFHSSDYTVWLGNRKGPGRISSTARDLLIWDQSLYQNRLVSQSTLEEAYTSGKLNSGATTNYGFGWVVTKNSSGQPVIYHTGSNPGYATIIIRLPSSRETFIMLNNNDHESKGKLTEVFLK